MISTLLRIAAFACCLIITLSLLFFVVDQSKSGDAAAQQEIQGVLHPTAAAPKHHGQPRRFIDHASHDLTTPFNGIVSTHDQWVKHIVPAVLGIILFGFGLGFLARAVSADS